MNEATRLRGLCALACTAGLLVAACSDDATSDGPTDAATDAAADVTADAGVDTDGETDAALDTTTDVPTDVPLPTEECDESLPPIVLAHGFLASGDTWASFGQRFASNGWCVDRIVPYDWDSLDRASDPIPALDALIDDLRDRFDADTVFLAGHSAGGGVGYDYLADPERAAKVAAYAHIGSFSNDAPAGAPTLHLYSLDDYAVTDGTDIPGATNVALEGVDHYGVATSAESFAAVYEHFMGEAPATTDIVASDVLLVSGRALAIGTNAPMNEGPVEVWRIDSDTGLTVRDTPDHTFTTTPDGYWGPFAAEPGAHYAFAIVDPANPDVPVTFYYEPFTRTDAWVYLRSLPPVDSLAGILLAGLPREGDAAAHVNFTRSTGVIAGEDSITINGIELLTEDTAAVEDTTIALFVYDVDADGETDATPDPTFEGFPFLAGYDVHLPAGDDQTIEVVYNDRTLRARALRPGEEGVTVSVFN